MVTGGGPTPRPIGRRAVAIGAVWAVPTIAAVSAAPAYAASPCAPVPFPAGWTVANPATGALGGGGSNGYTTTYVTGTNLWLSVQDPASTASSASTANDTTITLATTLSLVPGKTYTFSVTIGSQHGGNNASAAQLQLLDIQFNGVSVAKYTTQSSSASDSIKATRATGYTLLSTPSTGIGSQTVTFSYTPTVATVQFQYLWTIPALGYNLNGQGNPRSTYSSADDIAVSAPAISGC